MMTDGLSCWGFLIKFSGLETGNVIKDCSLILCRPSREGLQDYGLNILCMLHSASTSGANPRASQENSIVKAR